MPYDIIVGRTEKDKKEFGEKGAIFLGRHYVKMGQTTSLSSNVFLDLSRPHVILVCGKRGSGKSYTLSVISEEMTLLPPEISNRLSILLFDTLGVFWTMKYPNKRQEDLLKKWGIKPESLPVSIFTPKGYFQNYIDREIPTDYEFSLLPSELNAGDWCSVFEVKLTSSIGILIERVIGLLNEKRINYSINDIIEEIKKDKRTEQRIKDATENRFSATKTWGLFSENGTKIKDLIKKGQVSILDISCYTNMSGDWSIKGLVIGLICRKILNERIEIRKGEELNDILYQSHYFTSEKEESEELPLVWLMIDEAHEFLPKNGSSPATSALVQLLREGRQPGISMVLATQQPGEIHQEVMTQSDIVISHRITAKPDISALNNMMQSYLSLDILNYLNSLPKESGAAIILDDNSERIFPMAVHPKRSWHGGEAPTALHKKKRILDLEL